MKSKNMLLQQLLFSIPFCALFVLTTSAQKQALQCYVQGECPNASFLPPISADDYNRCLTICQECHPCQWFTFYPLEQLCLMISSCPDGPTEECGEPCFSGEVQCEEQPLQCDVKGLWCDSPVVGVFTHVEDLQECKYHCYQEPLCQWYNFDEHTEACLLTSSCNPSNITCATCVAGQKECLGKNLEMNKLMILGGYPNEYAVEIIDLSGNSLTCPELENGPLSYGQVGAFIHGHAMMCAGENGPSQCYTYENETDTWILLPASLQQASYYFRGGVVLDDGRWWITGGKSPSTAETEIFDPEAGAFEPFTALPRPEHSPIMLSLNESATIFLGGYSVASNDVWVFNWDSNNWTQMPNMPTSRLSSAAGLANFPDGSRQLVVVGGEGLPSTTTDIFDFETNTWRQTTISLPYGLYAASAVQFHDTFLIVGGRYDNGGTRNFVGTIFEFDPANERWIEREETMRNQGTNYSAFLMVPDDYVQCV